MKNQSVILLSDLELEDILVIMLSLQHCIKDDTEHL